MSGAYRIAELESALDIVAKHLNSGPVDKSNQTATFVLFKLLDKVAETHAPMVINYWTCILAQHCGKEQAIAIVNEWAADGTLSQEESK